MPSDRPDLSKPQIALPGRDFHLPAKIGDWSPYSLNEYIRSLFQNDPTMMPASLSLKHVIIEDIVVNNTSVGVVANVGPREYGIGDQNGNLKQGAWGADASWATGIEKAMGAAMLWETFPRKLMQNATAIAEADGYQYCTAIYIPVRTVITNLHCWVQTAGIYTADNTNKLALYGPWTAANKAAVPQIDTTADDPAIFKTVGLRTKALSAGPYTASPGIYFISHLVNWSAVVTQPRLGEWQVGLSTTPTVLTQEWAGTGATAIKDAGPNNTLLTTFDSTGATATRDHVWYAVS